MITIQIQRLAHAGDLPLPERATTGSAGFDVASAESGLLAPGERKLFATGFAVAIPLGYEIQLRPRSGLALKHGVTLPNTPATIDSDYRGELKVALINHGATAFEVTRGMRIAQIVVARVEPAEFQSVNFLPATERGAGGFGSTGLGG
ncbi:MAG: dUTP diphosphatase [Gemmatimonadales bacterium]|nr:dUTP diphosphatase [Gemmatimonadales bacterium]